MNSIDVPLNAWNRRKMNFRMNLIAKYLFYPLFYSMSLLTSTIFTTANILAYYYSAGSAFTLIITVIWAILLIIWFINFTGIFIISIFMWYAMMLYMRYKFNEVHNKVMYGFITGNKSLIIKAFVEHNLVSQNIHRLNHFFNYMVFVIYFFAVPAIEILIYLAQSKESNIYVRWAAAYTFIVLFIGCSLINLWCARMTASAHKSYKLMFKVMCSRRMYFSIKERLRVMTFIEKLSGPDIGFYCLNLFPMNGINFAQYLYVCGANYFLIMGFVW